MPQLLSISEVADLSGVPVATIRIWETRYGWPNPTRTIGNERQYTRELADEIKRLGDLIDTGTKVGDIILDGQPHWPTHQIAKPVRPVYDFSSILQPKTTDGKRVRAKLEAGFLANEVGIVGWAETQATLLHPNDRNAAVFALIALVKQTHANDQVNDVMPIAPAADTEQVVLELLTVDAAVDRASPTSVPVAITDEVTSLAPAVASVPTVDVNAATVLPKRSGRPPGASKARQEVSAPDPASPTSKRRGRPPGAAKIMKANEDLSTPKKRGRPPGSAKAGVLVDQAKRRGRPAASPKVNKTPKIAAALANDPAAALAIAADAIKAAMASLKTSRLEHKIQSDRLAQRVHAANAKTRAAVEFFLDRLA